MERATQKYKDFSVYGFPVSVLFLIMDFYNQRNPVKDYTRDFEILNARTTALEKQLSETTVILQELRNDMKVSNRITCNTLTKVAKALIPACDK
jgi:hypothetical protein